MNEEAEKYVQEQFNAWKEYFADFDERNKLRDMMVARLDKEVKLYFRNTWPDMFWINRFDKVEDYLEEWYIKHPMTFGEENDTPAEYYDLLPEAVCQAVANEVQRRKSEVYR
jgi:hypothetical protein